MESAPQSHRLGLIGTVIGLIALCGGVLHFFLGPIEPPAPVGATVAKLAASVKRALNEKVTGKKQEPAASREWGPDRVARACVIVAGLLAIVFGVVAFVRREAYQPAAAAVAVGGGAIAFQFAVLLAAAILLVLLVGVVMSALEGG